MQLSYCITASKAVCSQKVRINVFTILYRCLQISTEALLLLVASIISLQHSFCLVQKCITWTNTSVSSLMTLLLCTPFWAMLSTSHTIVISASSCVVLRSSRLLKCPENSSTGVGSRPDTMSLCVAGCPLDKAFSTKCSQMMSISFILFSFTVTQPFVVAMDLINASGVDGFSGSTCYTLYGVVIVSVKGEVNIWVSCFCHDITKEVICIILNCSFLWATHCPQKCAPVNDCSIHFLH